MTIHDSRLKSGTLTLTPSGTGATALDLSCQITNVRITSAYSDDGDPVTTLCGDSLPAPRKLDGHKMEGTIVQDFGATGSVVDWMWLHDLEIVAYEYIPNDVDAPTLSGNLQVEIAAETYGGDVNARLTSDFVWNLQGKPTFTPAAPLSSAAA